MPTCAAVGCDNRAGECPDKSISFHHFPIENDNLLKEWLKNLGRGENDSGKSQKVKKPWRPKKTSKLCSRHFTEDCFQEDMYAKFGLRPDGKIIKNLKPNAVPTIFVHKQETKPRPHTERRLKRKAQQELLGNLIDGKDLHSSQSQTDHPPVADGQIRDTPKSKLRKKKSKDNENTLPAATFSSPDNEPHAVEAGLFDPSPLETEQSPNPDAETSPSSPCPGPSEQYLKPLTNLPDGYYGLYDVVINGQKQTLVTYPTPGRLAKDHSYASRPDVNVVQKQLFHEEPPCVVTEGQSETKHQVLENRPVTQDVDEVTENESSDGFDDYYDPNDPDYDPQLDIDNLPSDGESEYDHDSDDDDFRSHNIIYHGNEFSQELRQEKFIVFEDNLLQLMKFCKECGQPVISCDKVTSGSGVSYKIECHSGHTYTWTSQSPTAPLLITSSILATGNSFTKIASFAKAMNLKFIGKTTYQNYQRENVIPVIQKAWNEERQKVVEDMKRKENLILAGDARCDSPGYNAKFGSYTLMDTSPTSDNSSQKKIVSLEMVQVSEVKNSNHMEPEGMTRCLKQVKDDGLKPVALATDRHVMVTSILKKDHPDIDHQFDIWHLVKSILKKLMAKAKQKNCEDLSSWIKSITNHMWWCAESCEGDAQLLREKWLSLLNHITNKHKWSGSHLFHKCSHRRLTTAQKHETMWLDPKSESFKALKSIITETRLMNALPHITRFCHTGELEVFHSMLLKYCQKRQHFQYDAMKARLLLAALDWNSQTRKESRDENGKVKEIPIWSKRRGQWVKRVVYTRTTENHVAPLMQMIVECFVDGTELPKMHKPDNIPAYVAKQPKPEMSTIVRKSRFGKE